MKKSIEKFLNIFNVVLKNALSWNVERYLTSFLRVCAFLEENAFLDENLEQNNQNGKQTHT